MALFKISVVGLFSALAVLTDALERPLSDFEALQHLGANSPWFPGPNVNHISSEVPGGCKVDQAVYVVRHGSRYPDPGAYQQWADLHEKIQSAKFTARGELSFLSSWEPVLKHPSQQVSQVSPTGYQELYDLGVELQTRYPDFYEYNTPFLLWSNDYQRTIDSARLFARGYLGPNSTLADVHVVNAKDASAVGNSLATSDSCPTFKDVSGGDYVDKWDSIYLPPIVKRLSKLIEGNLTLNASDLSLFPYLCGFESQVTRRVSPFCSLFRPEEILQYEYRQDLRYYYGTGKKEGGGVVVNHTTFKSLFPNPAFTGAGAFKNSSVMFPVLQGVVDLLSEGPGVVVKTSDGQSKPLPPLIVAFTHDNQINELASILGVFDGQKPLPADRIDSDRIYVSSRVSPMRGTITFERLNCTAGGHPHKPGQVGTSVRIRLNDAVYPVQSCSSGPGLSCPIDQYAELVEKKFSQQGTFASICGIPESNVTGSASGGVTFFTDLTLPSIRTVKP